MTVGTSDLGSLTQSARQQQLKSARGILLAIGFLTIVVNSFFVLMAPSLVKEAIDKEVQQGIQQGLEFDQEKLAEVQANAVVLMRLLNGGAVALGVLFVVFGLIVNKYPVPITILSLVLYIGAAAVFGLIDPATLAQGLVWKIIIIVMLAKSIGSALAYEREKATFEDCDSQVVHCQSE